MTHFTTRSTAAQINPQKGFRTHLLVFLLVTPALWIAWYVTGNSYIWPLWSTPFWATGLLFHYLGVFVFKHKKTNAKSYTTI